MYVAKRFPPMWILTYIREGLPDDYREEVLANIQEALEAMGIWLPNGGLHA